MRLPFAFLAAVVLACQTQTEGDPVLPTDELPVDDSPDAAPPAEDTGSAPVSDAATSTDVGVDAGPAALFAQGQVLQTTGNLNLRSAADSSVDNVLRVMMLGAVVVVVDGVPSNTFVRVSHHGLVGWASTRYLQPYKATNGDTPERALFVARAASGVGFGYWWGHGRWLEAGPTAANKGICTGDCPNCTYAGTYGADCSGYLAKIWQVPSSNSVLATDSHPYTTDNFYNHNNAFAWHDVLRDRVVQGDALVYRTATEGHILLVHSGDAWGSLWSYEARGCAEGIVHDLRNVPDAYKGIGKAAP